MEAVVQQMQCQRHWLSTRKNYQAIWGYFNQFFLHLDHKPTTWGQWLMLFVTYLIQSNRKSTMIKSYISAIKAVLRNGGINLRLDTALLGELTQACHLKSDTVHTKLPITFGVLHLLLNNMDKTFSSPQPYLSAFYKALYSTAYYGLFRVGELTQCPHVVKAKDVHVATNKLKMMFILHTSKTHNKGNKPQIIKIKAEPTRYGNKPTTEKYSCNKIALSGCYKIM